MKKHISLLLSIIVVCGSTVVLSCTKLKPQLPQPVPVVSTDAVITGKNNDDILHVSFVPDSSTLSQYIACGSTGVTDGSVATYSFQSGATNRIITELQYSIATTDQSSVVSVRVGNVTAPVIAGTALITGLHIPIPSGRNGVKVYTYISYAGVGVAGTLSGTEAMLVLNRITSKIYDVTYRDTVKVPAVPMSLVVSKPTVSITDPIGLPFLVSGTYVEALPVAITADPAGDIVINTIPFNAALINATVKTTGAYNFVVKDRFANPICNLGYFMSPYGGDAGVGFAFCGGVGHRIPAGTTEVFHIFIPMDMVGPSGSAYLYTRLRSPDGLNWTDVSGGVTFSSKNIPYLRNYPQTIVVVSN